jgi:hypothetical protein
MAKPPKEKTTVAKIPLPALMVGVLVVGVLLVLATGGHLPTITTPPASGTAPTAPQPPITGQSWDEGLISLALAMTTRLLWVVPVMLVVAGFLHVTHVWAHHTRPLLIRVAVGALLLFLVPVFIVVLPHLLSFRDHIVQELVGRG